MSVTQRRLFLKHIAPTNPFSPVLEVKKANGIYLYDEKGNEFIDAISGICVSSLGHQASNIVKAVQKQAENYLHTMVYGEYVLSPQVKLAELLVSQLPATLNQVYFVNSGSEAVEGALKLAKRYTGRPHIVSCANAYHGSTQGAMSLMSSNEFTRGYHPLLPGVSHIRFNEAEDFYKIDDQTACVILEPIQAEGGVILPKNDYLKKLKAHCQKVGALLIYDEIQVGMGRTGKLFAFEHYDAIPDVLLLAKAFGGGMPLGAFVSDKEIFQTFTENPMLGHITTFGGHPVSCAAGEAALRQMVDEPEIIEQVRNKSSIFVDAISKHPLVKTIRAAGLLIAIEFENEALPPKVLDACMEQQLIVDFLLFNPHCIRIAPPLTITEKEMQKITTLFTNALNQLN